MHGTAKIDVHFAPKGFNHTRGSDGKSFSVTPDSNRNQR